MNAPIEINPDLDASVHAELDAREGVVRIPDVVTPAGAERLNTPDVVAIAAAVTGERALTRIDGQATWFRPGDFLALHNDTGVGERRAACTLLGLTRGLRPSVTC